MYPNFYQSVFPAQGHVSERPLLVNNVVRLTDMCASAIRWHARRGSLRGFRNPDTPKIWRFRRSDVEVFIAGRDHVLPTH